MERPMNCLAGLILCLPLAGPALAQDEGSLLLAEPGSSNLWTSSGPQGTPARYSDKLMHRGVESCVAVGMIIESDGSTSAHRVLKIAMRPQARENDADLRALVEAWGLSLAKQYRYTPGPDNAAAEPAYTATVFAGGRGGPPKGLQQECEIADLSSTITATDTVTRAPAK